MHKQRQTLSLIRKKFLRIFLPIWLSITLIPLIVICVLMARYGETKYEPHMLIFNACTLGVGLCSLAIFLPWINRKEAVERELKRFAYLFKEPKPLTEKEVVIQDEYMGMTYTLTQNGILAEWEKTEQEEEQVFDEAQENRRFTPWKETNFMLATQKGFYCVHIALAVIFEQTADHTEGMAYFIPMREELYQAICAFDLKDKLDGGWTYLIYNPKDAFEQIMKKGRITVMRNKKTGKIFVDKNGNFTGDEE